MKKSVGKAFLIFASILIVGGSFAAVQTYRSISQLKALQVPAAARSARSALSFVQPLSLLTLRQIPDIETWRYGLLTISEGSKLLTTTKEFLPLTLQSDPGAQKQAQTVQQSLETVQKDTQKLLTNFNRSLFAKKIILSKVPPSYRHFLTSQTELPNLLQDATTLSQTLLTGHHRYIILLQNSEELRATGGFMGSYALLELQDGVVQSLHIKDIYEPDGQFTGKRDAPPGVKEYLSEGNGFRLPDSNWNPDFPLAGPEILEFFTLGKETELEGIVAINLQLAEKILETVGPVDLPEYTQTVTAENLSILARADRNEFFPGSQQKKNFLQALINHLKLRIQELPAEKQKELALIIWQQIQQKNVQVFSQDSKLQTLAQKYTLSGAINTLTPQNFSLFLVESNVGINKSNKKVSREVRINAQEYRTTLTIHFTNRNTSDHYINYQRLFLQPDIRIHTLEVQGEKRDSWDENLIITSGGDRLKQLGFLVTVPAESSHTVTLELTHPPKPHPQFLIQKQSGLPSTPYTIRWQDKETAFILEEDELITFQ